MSRVIKRKPKTNATAAAMDEPISKATHTLKGILAAMKGADAEPVPMPRGAPSPAVMYKLMGKIFAILSIRGEAFVIVKCEPSHADILRQSFAGIGHRSHLDRRIARSDQEGRRTRASRTGGAAADQGEGLDWTVQHREDANPYHFIISSRSPISLRVRQLPNSKQSQPSRARTA